MSQQINWKKQLTKLVSYSNDNGFQVLFKKEKHGIAAICFKTKQITIQTSYTKEKQLYLLLHELGHYVILKDAKKYNNGIGYVLDNFTSSSMASKTAEIEEEFEAWNAGRELAKKLRLKIRRDSFERFKSKLLTTYFIWAVQTKVVNKLKNKQIREEQMPIDIIPSIIMSISASSGSTELQKGLGNIQNGQ